MAKKKTKKSIKHYLKNWFTPHKGNNHKPHLLSKAGLGICALIIIGSQLAGNFVNADKVQVLGYATSISSGEVISLTNQQRTNNGLTALSTSGALNAAAAAKAQDMFANNYWAHVSPSGVQPWYWITQAGYNYTLAGENLAKDFNTSSGVVNGWMASSAHRDNLLNPNYTNIGVAAVNGVLQGAETTLVVAMYATPAAAAAPVTSSPSAPAPSSGSVKPSSEAAPTPAAETPAPAPVEEAKPQENVPTVSLVNSGQTLANHNAVETKFGVLNPIRIMGTVDWTRLLTIVVLGTVLLVNVFRHTVVWRHNKNKNPKDIWFRTKPALQTGLLAASIIFVIVGSYGVVL